MNRFVRNLIPVLTVAVFLAASPAGAWKKGKADKSPVVQGGNFGLGLVIGEPDDWGVSGKIWMSRSSALQMAVGLDDPTILQCDYLWHYYGLIEPSEGDWPLYIGIGGALSFEHEAAIAVRGPLGMDYIFSKVPVDIFVELVPLIWFADDASDFKLDIGLGARYFF